MISDESQGKRFGHGCGAPGMNGELRVHPRTNTVVVVLANVDPPAATRLAEAIAAGRGETCFPNLFKVSRSSDVLGQVAVTEDEIGPQPRRDSSTI
jgi:hypothetical protein